MGSFDDKKKQAKEVSIISICQQLGMELRERNNEARWVEHPSLVIFKDTNKFKWYTQSGEDSSGDSIKFVQVLLDKGFKEAVDYLTESEFEKAKPVKIQPKRDFYYYFKHNKDFSKAYDYLVNERKIDKDIVNILHTKGMIQQDVMGNCVFVWSKSGKPVGATVQGLEYDQEKYGKRGRFKGIAKNSETNYGFNVTLGTPTKIFVFESPVDMLSFWSLNKNLTNCMLVDMEGVKAKSIFKFTNQMILSKGTTPHEGIYIGTDNDVAGHKLMDEVRNIAFVDKEGNDIEMVNLIPNDFDIPQENIEIYQQVCKGELADVDWLAVAAVHKSFSNLSDTNELSNYWKNDKFYGKNFVKDEKPQKINVLNESYKVAKELKECMNKDGEFDFNKIAKTPETEGANINKMSKKIQFYYESYHEVGFNPTKVAILKDWNDVLVEKERLQLTDSLLNQQYISKNNEELTVHKNEENDKLKAQITLNRKELHFFEADSPEEMDQLIKNYGFLAVDKEDRVKYQDKKTQPKRETRPLEELAR